MKSLGVSGPAGGEEALGPDGTPAGHVPQAGHPPVAPDAGHAADPGRAADTQAPVAPEAGHPPAAAQLDAGSWAVCCSGGGIRSAAYCLGALQSLERVGLLGNAEWILGVSGGSYIAASRALVAHRLRAAARQGAAERAAAGRPDAERAEAEQPPPAYAPGSPEELNLRDNTRYLVPNAKTALAGVLSLLLGAFVTFILLVAPLYAAAHAWGWLLRREGVLVPYQNHAMRAMRASVTWWPWWLAAAIGGGLMLGLFVFWWWTLAPARRRAGGTTHLLSSLAPDDRDRGANRASWLGWAAALAAVLALGMLALPPVISWLFSSKGNVGTIVHFFGFGKKSDWSFAALAGLIAAVAAVAKFCQAGLARWTALAGQANASAAPAGAAPSLLSRLGGWLRQQLVPWLGSAIVVLAGLAAGLLWVGDGAEAGYSWDQLWPVLIALGVMLVTRVLADVNRISMHDFYRWRLADGFAVTRKAAEERKPAERRRLYAEAAAARLSSLQNPEENNEENREGDKPPPGIVICATANINADRDVPPGRGGFCVSFDPEDVILHRRAGSTVRDQAKAATADYEKLFGRRRFTLFDVSAISGAAISPLMGTMTRQAYRILFTVANLRLGVWMPHPNVVRAAREHLRADPGRSWTRLPTLLWYLSPHPFWDHNASRNIRREAKLWAHVLRLREGAGEHLGRRIHAEIWWRVLQPTPGMLWAEAVGHTSYRSTWMYVTDGGHYDNLGLVEALRRGASRIVVLDASGDHATTWYTLGGAIALARVDAGVEIQLDPTSMVRSAGRGPATLRPGEVVRPWAHGTFTRAQPEGQTWPPTERELPAKGEIWVCKLGWWRGAPWDVRAYAAGHPSYPADATLEQLYDAGEFEAYHELGAASVCDAVQHGGLPGQPG